MGHPIVTLTTDFGASDEYVGAMKGVLLSSLADLQIVDITHNIPPGDTQQASYLLEGMVPNFPAEAVHLVVVDPGVGSPREILAVEHPLGLFVAPDNGVLTPYIDSGSTVSVERPDLYQGTTGETFHGRDRMAPVAAALASGTALADLGPETVAPTRHQPLLLKRSETRIEGCVIHIDHFGNAITNIPWSWVQELSGKVCTWLGEQPVCRQVTHYQQLTNGHPGFLQGSRGTIELALNCQSMAETYKLKRGDSVRVQSQLPPVGQPKID